MAFRVALSAGHYLGTPGKRCAKELDPNETREWVLNDRIVDRVEKQLSKYNGIETLRVDDTTGKKYVSNEARAAMSNSWKANLYTAVHHNALGEVFDGGGISAYIHSKNAKPGAERWLQVLYHAAVDATGLKGNRATPMAKKALVECGAPNCPAVLLECGFMDSTVDLPIILTDEYAYKLADGLAEAIAKEAGATLKSAANTSSTYGTTDISLYVLGPGSKGEQVKTLQMLLNAKGYRDASGKVLVVDGSYGPATKYAVQAFQRAYGLIVDGYAGHATLSALLAAV